MKDPSAKARAERLDRLKSMLENGLKQPQAALETLLSELQVGETQPLLWERLHAAADRDGKAAELRDAYEKVTVHHRLSRLPPTAKAYVLMNAANFVQGVLGDTDRADKFLHDLLGITPDCLEAYTRLERKFSIQADKLRLLGLYAMVAARPPRPADEMARATISALVLLTTAPLPDAQCKQLMVLATVDTAIVEALVSHCKNTGRMNLACALLEQAIADGCFADTALALQRRKLVGMYLTSPDSAPHAIEHVEELLRRDPMDAAARLAAEKLLSSREVASRAAAALADARRRAR